MLLTAAVGLLPLARLSAATEFRWGGVCLTSDGRTEWQVLKDHQATHSTQLHYVDRLSKRLFFLEVWPRPPFWWRWDSRGIGALKSYLFCRGGTNVKGEVLADTRLPTYFCEYDQELYGYKGRVMGRAVLTADHIYFVGCESRGGDPTKDVELVSILASLRFSGSPRPPGRYWGFELMVLGCLAAAACVVLVVLRLRSAHRRRNEEIKAHLRAARHSKLGVTAWLHAHRLRMGIDPGEVQVYALVVIVLLIILGVTGLLNAYGIGVVGVGAGLYVAVRIAMSKAKGPRR